MQKPKQDRPWPPVSEALITRLEETYPDRAPTLSMNERQVWMAAGAATVVRKLRSVLQQQSTTVLSSTS